MEVRIIDPLLESIACGRASPGDLPPEVAREIQMIVFWFRHSRHSLDASAFARSVDANGNEALQLSHGYRLQYEEQEDLITFTELLCK
jgi:hypothetical protein